MPRLRAEGVRGSALVLTMNQIWKTTLCIVIGLWLALATAGSAAAVIAKHGMVAAEHPLAADAGVRILKAGGNAVDAAAATALAVGVANPSSCGIGGGGFMLIYIAKTRKIYALDFREKAPLPVTASTYMRNGKPDENLLRNGPLAVAVPGEVAGLAAAVKRFGKMSFSRDAQPAINLAHNGFPCGEHLAKEISHTASDLAHDEGLKAVFLHSDGTPRGEGEIITQVQLAATLQALGDHPVDDFYHGDIATRIAAFIKSRGGLLSTKDLADYGPVWRAPLQRDYRGYRIFSMPPPSSGGGMLLEALEILEPGKGSALGLNSPPYLARLVETMRQIFIDRATYYGDPDFVHVPIDFLLSPARIDEIRRKAFEVHHAPDAPLDHGTSHLCVVDRDANVVSLTTTVNTPLGARMTVPHTGIILNDEMDDFALAPGVANVYGLRGAGPNSIAPGKRPLSSMTPTIVLKDGSPVLTLGGSGGPTIVTATLQVLLNVLDFHLDPERAIRSPRIHHQFYPATVLIEQAMPAADRDALAAMGFQVKTVPVLGDEEAIQITADGYDGAADPRKGGAAVGY
jgi:gamma-glutamyltranspeptidase/glutathione hydrolase